MAKPAPFLPNIYRVVLLWTAGANTAANVLHFQSSTNETTLYSHLNSSVTSGMWNHSSLPARISTVTITHLDNLTATQEFPTVGTNWAPTTPADDYTPAVATLVSTQTGFRGLGSHGRIYLPWTADPAALTGILSSGLETALQTAWNTFKTAMGTAGSPLQVTSYGVYRKLSDGPPSTWEQLQAPVSHSVTTLNVRSALATQRRRQTRVQSGISTFLAMRQATEEFAARNKPTPNKS